MNKTRVETVKYKTCDGCEYVISLSATEQEAGVKIESTITTLRIPWEPFEIEENGGVFIEFHFHGPESNRRDCFRYWAHSTHIMRRSLTKRDFNAAEIDEFMSTHLYRDPKYSGSPGLTRPA